MFLFTIRLTTQLSVIEMDEGLCFGTKKLLFCNIYIYVTLMQTIWTAVSHSRNTWLIHWLQTRRYKLINSCSILLILSILLPWSGGQGPHSLLFLWFCWQLRDKKQFLYILVHCSLGWSKLILPLFYNTRLFPSVDIVFF